MYARKDIIFWSRRLVFDLSLLVLLVSLFVVLEHLNLYFCSLVSALEVGFVRMDVCSLAWLCSSLVTVAFCTENFLSIKIK